MATVTPVYNWPVPTSTDYVKDGATAIESLGDAIDSSLNTITGNKNVGLQLISSQTLTNSTGVSFSGMVVGERYRLVASLTSGAANVIYLRFRENSTDKATNYYWALSAVNLSGSFVGAAGNPDTLTYLGNVFTNGYSSFSHDIYISSLTTGQAVGSYWDSTNGRWTSIAVSNSNMSNFNGISIIPSSTNMSGKLSLYRYA